MNTHDIELPEPDSYLFQHEETGLTQCVDSQQVEWGFEKNNPRWQKIVGMYTENQVRAAIEADRQRRGEPVAWRCEDCPPVGYSTDVTRCEPCDRRSAPQPAEPVKVPSYDAEVQAFIACDGMGAVIVEGPRYAAVVRALLASYANTSKSSEEIDTSAESVDGVGIIETPEES